MNTRKDMKTLVWLVCAVLCLTLAASGLSEGDADAKLSVDSAASGQAKQEIGPSEIYYPSHPTNGQPTNSGSGGASPEVGQPVPNETGDEDELPPDFSFKGDGYSTVDGITYVAKDGSITVVSVMKKALKNGALVIPKEVPGIPGVVKYIYEDAFKNVKEYLTSVTIPGTVAFIWDYAFIGCNALQTIRFGGSEAQWNQFSMWLKLPKGCTVEFGQGAAENE